jgi:hypothetical protein
LQKHYELSKVAIEKEKIREYLRPIIDEAMRESKTQEKKKQGNRDYFINAVFLACFRVFTA